ncbi:MAG: hypothetical protein ABIH79_00570 [archaeon]
MPKKGSEGGKIKKKLNLEFIKDPTTLDLTPTSPQMLRANPGGAIPPFVVKLLRKLYKAKFKLTLMKGKK